MVLEPLQAYKQIYFSNHKLNYYDKMHLTLMTDNQLNLFSEYNESFETGIKLLSELKFNEAKNAFTKVLELNPDDDEVHKALELITFWKAITEHCFKLPEKESVHYFHELLFQFNFAKSTADKTLQLALRVFGLNLMMKADIFELSNGLDIADICIEIKKENLGVFYLENRLIRNTYDSLLLSRIADLQWTLNDTEKATKNYTLALLTEHDKINIKKIKHENLKKIIEKHGT